MNYCIIAIKGIYQLKCSDMILLDCLSSDNAMKKAQQHFESLIAGAVEPLPAESVDELCKICNLPLANHANGRHGYHQPETKG